MERDNFTYRGIGHIVNYTCEDGYNLRPSEVSGEFSILGGFFKELCTQSSN